MRANGRRGVLATALVLVSAVLTGCSGGGQGKGEPTPVAATTPARTTAATPVPEPVVGLDEAQRVLTRMLATDDVLRAGGDLRMALEIVRDGQTALTTAAYRATDMAPPRYTWGHESVFVPRLDRPPYWFTAVVERRDAGQAGRSGRKAVAAPRPAILTFMRQDDESRWQLSFASLLSPGESAPPVALDAEGYATALSTRDETLEISPQLMAPLHATVAEEGAQGFSAALIAPGDHTTGYSAQIAERKQQARHDGLNYDSIFGATQAPVFGLRTRDGGGLVQYGMTRTTTLSAKLPSAPWIEVPKDARWASEDPAMAKEMRIVETHQYAALVPALNAREPAEVIAFDGAITRVTGR
ncbi:hypothetical protein [Spongiactinospora sp. TRM90649]|uniref:hypothetical protein n=1 Tax=Spongiactinospora sp. TRM90649 TaxID=3031114 RepID=UPI0023F6BD23|nr:hypothetical protein [Spongiactinospora sp. TRM90649]MDF5751113.1 hypothetical protein [Spongiactinospora sp. TRM90649]